MKVEQIYTGCLAQGAYYVVSDGEAAIIDPLREIEPYIERAKKDGVTIKYIFETHFHADFVSGHVDLSRATGASIVFGPTKMKMGFDCLVVDDGREFKLGKATIEVLHTPGHTMESSCYLLKNEQGKDSAIFTGDTLFIGDVGRPDLAQHVIADLTQEKLAAHLYDSLHDKILPLADDIIVYPAHGAGSACGKNMSKETSDTLGNQKRTNYALDTKLSKEEFVKTLLKGLTPPPGYFPANVLMNINGYDNVDQVVERGARPLSPAVFTMLAEEPGTLVLDTRSAADFANGHVPGSVFIGIDGSFAVWVGTLVRDIKQRIIIVADEGREKEVVTRLARVGYDHAAGYLAGGIDGWRKDGRTLATVDSVTASVFAEMQEQQPLNILDVRKRSEYDSEHIIDAVNVPLDYVNDSMLVVDRNKQYFVHCAGGYRSMIFISILKSRGFSDLINVEGGFKAIKESGKFAITDYVCPTTML